LGFGFDDEQLANYRGKRGKGKIEEAAERRVF
jgi:hypothetical protein